MDIWTEKGNDSVRYDDLATQEDLDKFQNCKKNFANSIDK